jgi:hemerythrin-like metal-binding protein
LTAHLENIKTYWNSNNLLMNIPIMDIQHLWLVSIITEITEILTSPNLEDISIDNQIGEILNYVDHHFKLEETILEKLNYPVLAVHMSQHKEFISHINQDIINKHILNPKILATQLKEFLINWLAAHINVEDKEYSYFIRGKNIDIQQISNQIIQEQSIQITEKQINLYNTIIGDWKI